VSAQTLIRPVFVLRGKLHTLPAKVSRLLPASIPLEMDEAELSKYFSRIGRKGGIARAQQLTPERRKEIATRASKAAAKVRTRRAKQRARDKS